MKRILVFAVALLVAASMAQAAEVTTEKGTKAMVFKFQGLSYLGVSGYEGGIGMRYYLRDALAVRPGLEMQVESETTEGVGGSTDKKYSTTKLGLSAALEKHMPGPANISPYIGGGIQFSYSKITNEPSHETDPPPFTALKSTTKKNSFGLFGILGFEWGFAESMTFGGEYQLDFEYSSGDTKTDYQDVSSITTDEKTDLSLGFGTASVFISINW